MVERTDKKYTLTLADTVLPPDPITDRDQATLVYEFDFSVSNSSASSEQQQQQQQQRKQETHLSKASKKVFVPWTALRATYRGREKTDAPPLDVKNVQRISLMIRR